MTEINSENINNLITNDVKQFMKKKERSERQKENDAKLKDRLKLYHQQKKEAKLKEQEKQEIAFKHIQDTFREIQEMKSSVNDDEEIAEIHTYNLIDENVEVVKSKRGRPKKHQHPGPTEIIAASV
jgi:type VI protein secretion system component VasK